MSNQYTFFIWACGFKTFLVSFLIGKLNNKFIIASFKKLTKFKNPFLNLLQRACCGIQKPGNLLRNPAAILKIIRSTANEMSNLG
jgi:hypothetical protein